MELELIHKHPQKMKFKHPLLFLHGAFSGAWCWKENYLDYFASQGFECLALSLRGHGESKSHKPLDQLSLRDYQKDLFSVIDQFEETLSNIELVNNFNIFKFDNKKNIYKIIFNGTRDQFLDLMEDYDYFFEIKNKIWLLK